MADLQTTETEAAELEGAATLDPSNVTDYSIAAELERFRTLRAEKEELLAKLDESKTRLLAELADRGATTFVHNGKVVARKSDVMSTRTDGKRFKAEHPDLFAEYQVVTSSVRLTVSK